MKVRIIQKITTYKTKVVDIPDECLQEETIQDYILNTEEGEEIREKFEETSYETYREDYDWERYGN